jgi:hypothetical protein
MKNISLLATIVVAFSVLTVACNKASLLGAELFEGDKLNLKFMDTLTIKAVNETMDFVPMYANGGIQTVSLPVGRMTDNFFGTTEAQLFANFSNITNFANINIDSLREKITAIDSVRLVLPYTAGFVYGDTLMEQELAVYRLTEKLTGDNINSNKTFAHQPTALARARFFPQPRTRVVDKIRKDTCAACQKTDTVDAFVSIRLPNTFGEEILKLDSATLKLDSATQISKLADYLKGFVIKAEKDSRCMLNFNISAASSLSRPAGIYIHYWAKGDTAQRQLRLLPYTSTTQRYSSYKHGYANAPIRNFLNNPTAADSLLTIQGLSGAYTRLEFTDLKKLGKIAVNKAELEVTVLADTIYNPIEQLLVLSGNSSFIADNRYLIDNDPIIDVLVGGFRATNGYSTLPNFGGIPYTAAADPSVKIYKMSITEHFQSMVNGKASPQLILYPHFKQFIPSRTILYGAKHPKYRMKLNLTYTKLD